jgi:tetratricopeptide (TPR) repeat protein
VQSLRAQGKNEEAGQLDQKLADLQKDLKRLNELLRMIGPQLADSGPCYEAGVIALRVGRKEQGRNLLEDALRRKGDHRPVHRALAGYYRESGELEKAEVQEALAEKR